MVRRVSRHPRSSNDATPNSYEQPMNRRDYLATMAAGAGVLATMSKSELVFGQQPTAADSGAPTTSTVEDRERRMKWWHEAKFGMFIHWGLYSTRSEERRVGKEW